MTDSDFTPNPAAEDVAPVGGQNPPPHSYDTADPNLAKLVDDLKAIQVKPNTSPFLSKLIGLVISLLSGQPAKLKESGSYSKSQQADILGTNYTISESLDGSIDVEAKPN